VPTEERVPIRRKGKRKRGLSSAFNHFAKLVSHWSGRPAAFVGAMALIALWAITGPVFHFSDTWQLVINTTTTIVTFLMVFVIQNQQMRDTEALQVKLDELLRVSTGQNVLMDLEELDEDELESIRQGYLALAKKAREELEERGTARKS
jgi:low affinity Fe/Cu permease